MDILDVDPLQKYMALFSGANGSGKSVAIASWLEKGSVYTFDFDGRMASVANWYRQRGLKRGQLTYDTYGPDSLWDAMVKLDKFIDNCPHALISLDSFTAITITAVNFSLRRRMKNEKGSKGAAARTSGDMIVPDMEEYKGVTSCVTQMLDLCKSIAAKGTAVVWTAHPVTSMKVGKDAQGKMEITQQTKYAAYGDKTDALLPIYFNEIYNFIKEYDFTNQRWERVCMTESTAEVMAKTALNIPGRIVWTDKSFYNVFTPLAQEGMKLLEDNKINVDTTPTSNLIKF